MRFNLVDNLLSKILNSKSCEIDYGKVLLKCYPKSYLDKKVEYWHSFLSNFDYSNFFQSYYYADLLRNLSLSIPVFFEWYMGEEKIAQLTAFIGYIPFSFRKFSFLRKHLVYFSSHIFPVLWWEGGPVCEESLLPLILSTFKHDPFFRLLRPSSLYHINMSNETLNKIFNLGYRVSLSHSIVVDLPKSKDEMYRKIKKTARKAIRYSKEKSVYVKTAEDEEEVLDFYHLIVQRRSVLGLPFTLIEEDFIKYWRMLRNKGFNVFLAYRGKDLIAGLGTLTFNKTLIEVMSAQSEKNYSMKLFAGDLIKWNVLERAIDSGLKRYDLAGVSIPPKTQKERNILLFKSKWGGDVIKSYKVSL